MPFNLQEQANHLHSKTANIQTVQSFVKNLNTVHIANYMQINLSKDG